MTARFESRAGAELNASRHSFDVLILGAGPAGLAAACCAAESGQKVGVVDDNPDWGGQIWRRDRAKPSGKKASRWMERIRSIAFEFLPSTQIISQLHPGSLLAEQEGHPRELNYQQLIVATGARERFLPFPGWTLPNVMGAGGLQALVKGGLPIEGKRVAIAGTGPLLLAVAGYLHKQGADIRLIAEQTSKKLLWRFGMSLWKHPGKAIEATGLRLQLRQVPYRAGVWPIGAEGDKQLTSVTFTNGKTTWSMPCDYLACGFGLVPNTELPALLGCARTAKGVHVDEMQRSSVPAVYCAGETTGIGGLDLALIEGQIAGFAATGRDRKARALFPARKRAEAFARRLEEAFVLRDELRQLPVPETLVCRCEDVPFAKLKPYSSWTEAKLQTRCGMGTCQGRICGPATEFLFGWQLQSVRPPLFPTNLVNLAGVSPEPVDA
ncbi:MAG: FAD-dependent oxidoreductase [Gemmataceae bacterium]